MRPTVCSVRQRQALRRRARSLNGRVHLVEHGVELVELRSQLLLGTAAEAAAWRGARFGGRWWHRWAIRLARRRDAAYFYTITMSEM